MKESIVENTFKYYFKDDELSRSQNKILYQFLKSEYYNTKLQ